MIDIIAYMGLVILIGTNLWLANRDNNPHALMGWLATLITFCWVLALKGVF